MQADLNNASSSIAMAGEHGPFFLIFIANCLTELSLDTIMNLISQLPDLLMDDGAIIIAEAQRDYIKKLIGILARYATDLNLYVFYPCPYYVCSRKEWCWVWRDNEYQFPDISIDGNPLPEMARDRLTLSWLILTKKRISIYDVHRSNDSQMTFGPLAQEYVRSEGKKVESLAICSGTDIIDFNKDSSISKTYHRGSIIGLSPDGLLKRYYELS